MIFRVSLSMSSEFQFRLVYHPNSIWQHSNCPSFNCNYVFFSTFCNTLFALYFWILLFSTVPLWYSGKSETQHTLPSNQLFSRLTKKTPFHGFVGNFTSIFITTVRRKHRISFFSLLLGRYAISIYLSPLKLNFIYKKL